MRIRFAHVSSQNVQNYVTKFHLVDDGGCEIQQQVGENELIIFIPSGVKMWYKF